MLQCHSYTGYSLNKVSFFLIPFTVASELLVISLDLVKNRIGVMSTDMRRNFIQVILTSLIEKSPDAKVLKTIVKMVEEWVKAKVRL